MLKNPIFNILMLQFSAKKNKQNSALVCGKKWYIASWVKTVTLIYSSQPARILLFPFSPILLNRMPQPSITSRNTSIYNPYFLLHPPFLSFWPPIWPPNPCILIVANCNPMTGSYFWPDPHAISMAVGQKYVDIRMVFTHFQQLSYAVPPISSTITPLTCG